MLSSLSHSEFLALAKTQTRIIVFKEISFDHFGAVESFKNVQAIDSRAVLLETADPENKYFTTTTIASRPVAEIAIKNNQCEYTIQNKHHLESDVTPFAVLRNAQRNYQAVSSQALPGVIGGSFGFISYESVKHLPGISELQQSDNPDYLFRFYQDQMHYDYKNRKLTIATIVDLNDDADGYYQALDRIETLTAQTASEQVLEVQPSGLDVYQHLDIATDDEHYADMVERAKPYILSGDIFQMVPSAEFKISIKSAALTIYQHLRKLSFAPYLCFSQVAGQDVMVASPEALVNVTEQSIETRPLAGTVRIQPGDDLNALAGQLQNSEKDGAEHMMLVDLSRNDLGKVAKASTVKVTALKEVLKLSHVMHLSSTVVGELKEDCDSFDAISATLPAGTLSGAPKIRAMQLINQLENSPRGYYGGCFCMTDSKQDLTSAIAIRMLSIKNGVGTIRAGGGIVHDSDIQEEVNERRNKARMLLEAILLAEKKQ
ncbi:anthranilate synthase component I family protein [Piscirickettsia litoralis]|uniref:Chorismate-binding protein n=1 Tax=Piscirickettsia litoralis TaxID=1891921 RepID=A0ABX3A2B7_9GAMM|nr:anthranilate synthase component I family protein [Piscirickettsia litoralis]ODN42991.1 chorismate-binding protein [Piscirickettsia litoralis]